MGMPAGYVRRLVLREKRLHRDRAREPVGGPCEGSRRALAVEFHDLRPYPEIENSPFCVKNYPPVLSELPAFVFMGL
jgi:hypothetical protein